MLVPFDTFCGAVLRCGAVERCGGVAVVVVGCKKRERE